MEQEDLNLVDQLLSQNQELADLWREHLELESKLEEMHQRVFLSD